MSINWQKYAPRLNKMQSLVSESLSPHGLQHTRLPCLSPTPGVCSNSCPLTHDGIQPSHPLSSPSPPEFNLSQYQGLFPMSQFFTFGGQSIEVSASVLPMNIQDWFALGLTGLISLQPKGLSRVFSNTTVQKHQFFSAQLCLDFSGGSDGKASACNVGDLGLITGMGRSPGEGNGNPLQYSCLKNSMDGGAW